ncbi:hypothetical protein KKE78_00845 [Patescibacteria group bacterium]|nr:hypothetical protein [Patescibacteria group bacterium]
MSNDTIYAKIVALYFLISGFVIFYHFLSEFLKTPNAENFYMIGFPAIIPNIIGIGLLFRKSVFWYVAILVLTVYLFIFGVLVLPVLLWESLLEF